MNCTCYECGKPATEDHHVIPESLGGTKTIPLCGGCHALVHGGYNKRRDDHVELTKAGIARARERGVALGNRTNLDEARSIGVANIKEKAYQFALAMEAEVTAAIARGGSYERAAEILNIAGAKTARGGTWSASSICRLMARIKNKEEIPA